MCRRKRSRPSSKRRLTKKLKRLSSGRSVCASAIGVVEEQRLRTNGPVLAGFAPTSPPSAAARAPEAMLVIAVISSPNQYHRQPGRGKPQIHDVNREVHARWRDRGGPAVIGTELPLDRWLCVPAFRRVCRSHCAQSQIVADCSQALKMCPLSQVLSQIGDT